MNTRLGLGAGALAFVILATANAGGYRYGVSDQSFYVPAVARAADPALFARDVALLAPQLRWWAGADVLAAALHTLPLELPGLFAVVYVGGLLTLFGAVVYFMRGLGASWWATAGAVAVFTLRHRIAKTGANSLEGYMHPRMIAFAIGLWALGCLLRRQHAAAIALVALAAIVHPTTALWFGVVVGVGFAVSSGLRRPWRWAALAFAIIASVAGRGVRMDAAWLAVLGDKDYLFPSDWPAYAWILNLAYPLTLWRIYRYRAVRGLTRPGEAGLIIGLLVLVAGFGVSVPLSAARIATVVQLQVNRVFWLADAAALACLVWFLIDGVWTRRGPAVRAVIASLLIIGAAARGAFLLHDTGRSLMRIDLPADDWTEAMTWLRQQPADWLVLADPAHAFTSGTSVRVAALRDTVLEQNKDSAMAMYDRAMALRVAERTAALAGFSAMTSVEIREAGARYGARVVVVERAQSLDLPVLHRNARFTIYDLR